LAVGTAFVLGLIQFAASKGTLPDRTIGWIGVLLIASVAVSSFWIHQIKLVVPWSPIHLLSILTLTLLPLAVWRALRHRVADHRRARISTFARAILITGLFTLLPVGSCTPSCSGINSRWMRSSVQRVFGVSGGPGFTAAKRGPPLA